MKEERQRVDLEMVRSVITGEPGAWQRFYRKYHRLMLACVRRVYHKHGVMLSAEEQEDLLANVCLNFVKRDFQKLRLYDPERGHRLSSWVGLISANTAYDALRRRGPEQVSFDDPDGRMPVLSAKDATPFDDLYESERNDVLQRAIEHLSAADREFVHYYYRMRMEPKQIATRLGISVNTVYSRKNKVKAKLIQIGRRLLDGRSP